MGMDGHGIRTMTYFNIVNSFLTDEQGIGIVLAPFSEGQSELREGYAVAILDQNKKRIGQTSYKISGIAVKKEDGGMGNATVLLRGLEEAELSQLMCEGRYLSTADAEQRPDGSALQEADDSAQPQERKEDKKMNRYQFKPTNLIAEVLEKRNFKYEYNCILNVEYLNLTFSVDGGPNLLMRFLIAGDGNDIKAYLHLLSNLPKEKRCRAMEACNIINDIVRHIKFCLKPNGDVYAAYDFPQFCTDDCIGDCAFEILLRIKKILDMHYSIFMKALYTDEDLAACYDDGKSVTH